MTVWLAVQCPGCHSTDVSKHGKSAPGKKRYSCDNAECLRRTFILDNSHPGQARGVKRQIVEMSLNGSGVRDIARGYCQLNQASSKLSTIIPQSLGSLNLMQQVSDKRCLANQQNRWRSCSRYRCAVS